MSVELNPYIEQLSWEEARVLIKPVNPDYVAEVDQIELPKEACIFKVKYRYGDFLMENGTIMLRKHDGENVPISHPELPDILRKKLTYAPTMPMGIVLEKTVEAFFKTMNGRIVPRGLMQAGYIFALTGCISENSVFYSKGEYWNLTAGTRSVYSAPKLSIAQKHKRLVKEFGIGYMPPKKINQHWETFKEIMQSPSVVETWNLEVLYFSKEWVDTANNNTFPAYSNYLLRYAYEVMGYFGNGHISDFIFSQIETDANIRRYPNAINTIRHLISIAGSFLPGLSYDCKNDVFPIDLLTIIYRDVYRLEYDPQFLSLKSFSTDDVGGVYYSMSIPMAVDYYNIDSCFHSRFAELRDMAHSLERIIRTISTNYYGVPVVGKSFLRGIEDCEFKIYHSHAKDEPNIYPISDLPELSQNSCRSTSIYRGIVGISTKEKKL